MVKLSAKFVIRRNRANKSFLIRKKGDSDKQFLNKITHLPLNNQFIDQILKMNDCENVKVLYLQNNLLRNIENMENFPTLTHLYLQRNFIVKLDNLKPLTNLKKIYLGRNEIQVLEGMEDLKNIKEVHIEHQDIPDGGTLYFEPLTVRNLGVRLLKLCVAILVAVTCSTRIYTLQVDSARYQVEVTQREKLDTRLEIALFVLCRLAKRFDFLSVKTASLETLHVLNISANRITSINSLKNLTNLRILIANDNLLADIDDITTTITEWYFLQKLNLSGNEVTRKRWYRDSIIFASQSLEILDSEPIHSNTRIFIQKLVQQKRMAYMKQKSKAEERGKKEKRKTLKFADEPETKDNRFDFTNSFPPPRPVYLCPAWKLRTNVNPVNPKTFLPRPYWKKKMVTQQKTEN